MNINHPSMRSMPGTELDGVLAPDNNPILTFSQFLGSGATNNRLTFIVCDTSDSVLDTTVFVSSLQGSLPPNADLAVNVQGPTNQITVGSNFTYRVTVTNLGPNLATGTVLSNILPANVVFVSAVPSQGSCVFADGVVICDFFGLDRGYGATVQITASPAVEGFLTNYARIISSLMDFGMTNNAATNVALAVNYGSFLSTDAIAVNDGAPATPYPATLHVTGVSGVITQTTVSLKRLTHSFPADLDILLVGPSGKAVMLMSDAGGNRALNDVTLTFGNRAPMPLPETDPISSGVYRPTDYPPLDDLLPPAPPGPYTATLDVFNGASPSGTWCLYVYDDMGQDEGFIFAGWSLTFGLDATVVELRMERQRDQLLIFWPAAAEGFALEMTPTLSSSPSWSTVTNSTVLVGDQKTVTVDMSGGTGYYRLKKILP